MDERTDAIGRFLAANGWGGAKRATLAADASFRRYDRIVDGVRTAVLMDAPPPKENVAPFVKVSNHLAAMGFAAPRVLAEDRERGFLLLEDLGDDTFTRALATGGDAIQRAGARQSRGEVPPEPAGCAGHQGRLARKVEKIAHLIKAPR